MTNREWNLTLGQRKAWDNNHFLTEPVALDETGRTVAFKCWKCGRKMRVDLDHNHDNPHDKSNPYWGDLATEVCSEQSNHS